ncbi:hypothetical protein CHL76_11185 [Marinococcus halophilus]|uniref:Flagellar protein FliT n=1 Tax=Marinococcus halophilus TaxID=1371 RepID=A0A510Y6Q4_MARHA|nr:hypothetical protein [Marinococcus halophilus]OZT79693.1 hypothetical protein CHL76_11185 [Marinococcus halophilus]GEK59049.1 hypothetical protein MHA01_19540 [Marinococcus halophilus]
MSVVRKLYVTTRELYEKVAQPMPVNEQPRDEYIESVDLFLQARDQQLKGLPPVEKWTEAERQLGEETIKMNRYIDGRLASWKQVIQEELQGSRQKRRHMGKYEQSGATASAYFFDSKN